MDKINNMGRRGFVSASALGIAAAGALAYAGTYSALAQEKDMSAADAPAASNAGSTAKADAQVPAWLGEEPQVDAADIIATDTCDLLIVGAGCAGLSAAATAAEAGLNFILVDRAQVIPETREYLGAINSQDVLDILARPWTRARSSTRSAATPAASATAAW